jgi:hypothetical protein
MATFTTTIQLHDADKKDYETLFSKLEKQVLKNKYHIIKVRQYDDGKSEYKWQGNVSIHEITNAIFRSVSGTGRKYSFTIVRKKLVTG